MKVEPLRTRGFLQMRTSAFFVQKLRIFRNLWCVRTDKGEKGQFLRFCADDFYGWPLKQFLVFLDRNLSAFKIKPDKNGRSIDQ